MKLIVLIVSILIAFTTFALAEQQPVGSTPEGYTWSSDKGALKPIMGRNKNVDIYLFDTYESLTVSKEKALNWGVTDEKDLTDLGRNLRSRLLKINDISSVAITYRAIMFRKFPLSDWKDILPEIKKALE